jgi:hypothetical protein
MTYVASYRLRSVHSLPGVWEGVLAVRTHQTGMEALVVGRDGRLSGPDLCGALQDGVLAGGIDVIDIGMVPTPLSITRLTSPRRVLALS